jgi:S-DNA-T family DNA segregation ATPase FtsK/SpoIIIE
VPNAKRDIVYIRQMINSKKFVETDMRLPVAFGKTIENETFMIDLTKMPHLLIAGATGSGKSVGINTIITCLLYKCHPDNLKFVLIDPKKIELSLYQAISRHFLATLPHFEEPIITDTSKVLEVLLSTCKEMDDRYDLLKAAMVRDIVAYNEKFAKGALDPAEGHRHLPYIVVIIDELADCPPCAVGTSHRYSFGGCHAASVCECHNRNNQSEFSVADCVSGCLEN